MARRGHGEGTIAKRGDGRWTGALSLPNGKRRWFYGKTRKEVQDALRAAQRQQDQGTLITGPRQTVGHYLTR